MQLRPYQQKAIHMLWGWFEAGNEGHPCVVMPTGSGKSHVIATICQRSISEWPSTRILMATHVKELIEQNLAKLLGHWPEAPVGVYSAGLRRKEVAQITFAGIQSVRSKPEILGHIDLIIVDECDLISHRDEGGYRKLIAALEVINPSVRVIGLTATPYRLGHGYITDKPALFSALIEPVKIAELIHGGFLAPLRSKLTKEELDVAGVAKRGGEYIESELQAAVDKPSVNATVAKEILAVSGDRKAWLVFCAGIDHAEHMRDALAALGVPVACVSSRTPGAERDEILTAFKRGEYRAVTNADILTTGFDYPDVDLIAMLRPTLSPRLYVQIAGRGMRPKSHTDHCLVLDFAGVVAMHGPITDIVVQRGKAKKVDKKPTKTCPSCGEIVSLKCKACPACLFVWITPPRKKGEVLDGESNIMGADSMEEVPIESWRWGVHKAKSTGRDILKVIYSAGMFGPDYAEYFCWGYDGWPGQKAFDDVLLIATNSLGPSGWIADVIMSNRHNYPGGFPMVGDLVDSLNAEYSHPPSKITVKRDGKFFRIMERKW